MANESDQRVETIAKVLQQHFTRRSNGGQFTFLTADDFRATPLSLAEDIASALNSPPGQADPS